MEVMKNRVFGMFPNYYLIFRWYTLFVEVCFFCFLLANFLLNWLAFTDKPWAISHGIAKT